MIGNELCGRMNGQETMVNFADDLLRNDLLKDSNGFFRKKVLKNDKTVTLIINISESFFHLMCVNSCRKQTFDYLYDCCTKDLNKMRGLNKIKSIIKKTLHLVELPVSHSNNSMNNAKVHLNVFNNRCCCEKCLSICYMFNVTQGLDLLNEFVRILSSEHCRHWHNDWLQILGEQIFIFLCCIKDGLVNNKLLESAASLIHKLFLSRNNSTSINQMKYSYIYFHMNLMNMVKLKENLNKQVDDLRTVVTDAVFKGTGKQELEMIDGIRIISFQTEAEMNEYTNLETKYISSFATNKPIVASKTNHLTKIKGWKRKLFAINNFMKSSEIENSEKRKEEINNQIIKSKKTEKYKENSNFSGYKSDAADYQSADNILNDNSETIPHQIVPLKSSATYITIDKTLDPVNRNVFESKALDEFLMNDSHLNISYEIPTLRAANIFANTYKADEVNRILKPGQEQLKAKMTDGSNEDDYKVSKSFIKVDGVLENRQTCSKSKKKSVGILTKTNGSDEIDMKTDYGDTMKRPRLLSTFFDEEDGYKRKKVEPPTCTDFSPTMIQFIDKCEQVNNGSQWIRSTLGMIKSIDKGTCISNETVENLQLLTNGNDTDKSWAIIASSALATENRSQKKTNIVPDISNKVLNSVSDCKERLALTVPTLSSIRDIDCGVISVVKELLDYVERNVENSFDIRYDPMQTRPLFESPKSDKKTKVPKIIRELRKLVNVSVLDKSELAKEGRQGATSLCGNDFCLKGCICSSLNNKLKIATHCGKFSCMFECSCPYQFRFCRNVANDEHCLAKEEISWQRHQTVVIRSQTGDHIEFVNKSQREAKLPKRFRNNVLIGDEFDYYLRAPNDVIPFERSAISRWVNLKKTDCLSRSVNKRRLGFCAGTLTGVRTLADVFIWCAVHDKYNCLCTTTVARLNDNTLIWKSNKYSRYLAHKVMINMGSISNYSHQVYLYDFKKFSARTYGIPFEYAVRNRSETFLQKRKCELEHGVLSYTNSFTKMKFFIISNREMIYDYRQLETKLDSTEVYRSSENKYIYISNVTDDEDVEIEIIEDRAPVTIDYIDTTAESNNYNCDHVVPNMVDSAPVCGHEDRFSPKMDDSAPVSGHEYKDVPNMVDNAPVCGHEDRVSPNIDDSASVKLDKDLDVVMNRLAVDERHDFDHVIIIADSDEEELDTVMPVMDHKKHQNERAMQSKASLQFSSIDNKGFHFILPRPRSNNYFFKIPSIKHHDTTSQQSAVNPFKKPTPKFKITERGMKSTKMKDNRQIYLYSRITGNIHKKLGVKENLIPPHYKYRLEEVDLELENGFIKLDDHPERNHLFGADNIPKLALMCLTPGIGYLPILEFKTDMLIVQDPIFFHIYRSFKGLDAANLWLNRFFKNRLIFESKDTSLKWVIVKPGVLKLKKCYPFKVSLLDKSSLMITKDGVLTCKGNGESAIRRERCPAVNRQQTVEHHLNVKRTNETCLQTAGHINIKRRKLHLEADRTTNSTSSTLEYLIS